jgi:hypothetical protein
VAMAAEGHHIGIDPGRLEDPRAGAGLADAHQPIALAVPDAGGSRPAPATPRQSARRAALRLAERGPSWGGGECPGAINKCDQQVRPVGSDVVAVKADGGVDEGLTQHVRVV